MLKRTYKARLVCRTKWIGRITMIDTVRDKERNLLIGSLKNRVHKLGVILTKDLSSKDIELTVNDINTVLREIKKFTRRYRKLES